MARRVSDQDPEGFDFFEGVANALAITAVAILIAALVWLRVESKR